MGMGLRFMRAQASSNPSCLDQAAEEKTLAWISKFTAKFDEDVGRDCWATCGANAANFSWEFVEIGLVLVACEVQL